MATETYTYGDNNQLLTAGGKSYSYDDDGNLTSVTQSSQTTTLAWDYNNKLTGITYPSTATNSFVTSDLGMRVSKTDSGGSQDFVYDGSRVVADGRAVYTPGGVTGLVSERVGGATKTYHGDPLGSTRGLTDGTQAVTDSVERDAFGMVVATSGSTATPFGFVGGQGYYGDSDSGLMLLGARYYDRSVGRFISRDPLGYGGGDVNVYRYCANDPVNATDPTGQLIQVVPLLAIATVVVVIATVVAVLNTPDAKQAVGDLVGAIGRGIGDVIGGIGDALGEIGKGVIDWWRGVEPAPPANWPEPPGWNEDWEFRYPDVRGNTRRWFDPDGGEWRWHERDTWHPDPHWDYNPWNQWNSPWQNIYPPAPPGGAQAPEGEGGGGGDAPWAFP